MREITIAVAQMKPALGEQEARQDVGDNFENRFTTAG